MTNKFLHLYIYLLIAAFPGIALAQDCNAPYELIFNMPDAKIGSYNVWDSIHGEMEFEERFVSAVPAPTKSHHLAVGYRAFKEGGPLDLMLVEIDHRGREEWQKFHEIKGLDQVVKVVAMPQGYLVLTTVQRPQKNAYIWLGFFDHQGELKHHAEIKNKKGHLRGHDIIASRKSGEYLLAVGMETADEAQKRYSMIYRLDSKGKVIEDRAYIPGPDNAILSLNSAGHSGYTATGYTHNPGGRKIGSLMYLNEDGSILWQRQYPRGSAAQLEEAVSFNDKYLTLVGTAWPVGDGPSAGWVMMIDKANGDVVWQRYYNGGYDYSARDAVVQGGVISVLLQGQNAANKEQKDYMSLLSINPRGDLLFRDAYYNGEGAFADELFLGPSNTRVFVGHTDRLYLIESNVEGEGPEKLYGIDGWMVAGAAAEPYKDPCKR